MRRPPPHFQGFNPHGEFEAYHRHLPHWRQPGATFFVTFRLADSLPQTVIDYISRMKREIVRLGDHPSSLSLRREYERQITQKCESTLDGGHGRCCLRDPDHAQILHDSLQYGQGKRYFLGCSVVMANHCHITIRPEEGQDLEQIVGSIKGFTARQINQRIGASGPLWSEECYDRIIRDEEHLYRVIQYVGRNPAKCGIKVPYPFLWIHPDWKNAGWDFDGS